MVSTAECAADLDLAPRLDLPVPAERRRLWAPGDPQLYDVDIQLLAADGSVVDEARSYAGLRSVAIVGKAILINGESIFQRLVLDQGYYPDGIMTAPDDEALRADIELSMAAGFNGARLHQKVFEERFLYHADRLGYLVWGEFGDWGCRHMGPLDGEHQRPGPDYITQWLEVLERDYSHPAIVGWCPLNETWQSLTDRITAARRRDAGHVPGDEGHGHVRVRCWIPPAMRIACAAPTSTTATITPRIPTSWYGVMPAWRRANPTRTVFEGRGIPERYRGNTRWSISYAGQPYFVSEFGGIWWNPAGPQRTRTPGAMASGRATIEEFYHRFERLCAVLLDDVNMFGYCYTQLTDILSGAERHLRLRPRAQVRHGAHPCRAAASGRD